jgi:hypothetical protein
VTAPLVSIGSGVCIHLCQKKKRDKKGKKEKRKKKEKNKPDQRT